MSTQYLRRLRENKYNENKTSNPYKCITRTNVLALKSLTSPFAVLWHYLGNPLSCRNRKWLTFATSIETDQPAYPCSLTRFHQLQVLILLSPKMLNDSSIGHDNTNGPNINIYSKYIFFYFLNELLNEASIPREQTNRLYSDRSYFYMLSSWLNLFHFDKVHWILYETIIIIVALFISILSASHVHMQQNTLSNLDQL